jgi:hypothetical protein
MVGREKLVNQHRQSFIDMGWKTTNLPEILISPTGKRIIIITWQAARADAVKMAKADPGVWASRYLRPGVGIGILFFDECHIGGCTNIDEKGGESSFKKIQINWKPLFTVYVSATGNTVQESLLGAREGHTYTYSMRQAYLDNMMHPVDLIEVHCGTTALIAKVQNVLGNKCFEIEGEDHNDLSDKLKEQDVIVPDKKSYDPEEVKAAKALKEKIITHRHNSMIDIYLRRYAKRREQAIFFCYNIEHADKAMSYINAEAINRGLTLNVRQVHTGNDEVESDPDYKEYIQQFEGTWDKNGKHTRGTIDVIFVVGMLQEGFDMPTLSLAFDCKFYCQWNAAKIARLLQKIGRLTRKHPNGPDVSKRYYYSRDIVDYYGTEIEKHQELPDIMTCEAAFGQEKLSKRQKAALVTQAGRSAAIIDGVANDDRLDSEVGTKNVETETEEFDFINADGITIKKRIHTFTTKFGGKELVDVSGKRVADAHTLGELIGSEQPAQRIDLIIAEYIGVR